MVFRHVHMQVKDCFFSGRTDETVTQTCSICTVSETQASITDGYSEVIRGIKKNME